MNPSQSVETQKVFSFMQTLVDEIGPRPAGSEAVQRTFTKIEEWMNPWGYSGQKFPFQFAPYQKFSPYYSLAGVLFLLAGWGLFVFPLLAVLLPFFAAGLPELWQSFQRRRKGTQPAYNMLFHKNGICLSEIDLIFCAHVDSARQNPVKSKFVQNFQDNVFVLMQRFSWMLLFFALFIWTGFQVPPTVIIFIAVMVTLFALALICLDIWEQVGHQNRYVPGAVDNASGVAILLELAEIVNENEAININAGFLFTDAEETGMHGAAAFAKFMRQQGLQTPVICLDQVGAGDTIRIVRSVGRFKPYRTDEKLVNQLYRAAPDARDLFYIYRNGDFSSFLREGIPAVSVETSGSQRAKQAYHRVEDNMRIVQPSTLERVTRTMLHFVRSYHEQTD